MTMSFLSPHVMFISCIHNLKFLPKSLSLLLQLTLHLLSLLSIDIVPLVWSGFLFPFPLGLRSYDQQTWNQAVSAPPHIHAFSLTSLYSFIHSFIHLFIHSSLYSFIHLFMHSFIYSFIQYLLSITKYQKVKRFS